MTKSKPPTFCYVGPPIEQTHGGSALLFKLLRDYPTDRFVLVELPMGVPKSVHRLNGVKTITLLVPPPRLGPRARQFSWEETARRTMEVYRSVAN